MGFVGPPIMNILGSIKYSFILSFFSGYGHGCSSGLGIFNFLLFLVVLLGLLNTLMNNAMINIMINGQNVSLFQVIQYNGKWWSALTFKYIVSWGYAWSWIFASPTICLLELPITEKTFFNVEFQPKLNFFIFRLCCWLS